FIVNRILLPYMNEAAYLFQEGIDTKRLDDIVRRFGMPMGPMELADEVGIDVGYHVAQILESTYGERMRIAEILRMVHEAGTLGKKSGEGFYLYSGKQKKVSNKVRNMCANATFTLDDDTTLKRLIYIMINEASRCLEEGVVESASTIDVGMIYGTGFPPFRGGLMRYADSVGARHIVADLKEFQARFDQHRFEPSQLLLSMADTNGTFYPS
ncbi:MAG TPA: enoyl-CoA hydratase, partial [Planctomycetaceae bacterium]|nr:enoyl-CoA hydratase [Planctomycetaceae bacterium]